MGNYKANKVYLALVGDLERLENNGFLKTNGHHLAQKLTTKVLIELLPKKQRKLWDALSKKYQTARELSESTGFSTKEISSHAKNMNNKGDLVHMKNVEGKILYKNTLY